MSDDFETLPDYLQTGLDIILVGINPSSYSVKAGHYFANPRNRFWAALNRSGLVNAELTPEQDSEILQHGIGFTDVCKKPTPQASGLRAADFRQWCPVLKEKLARYQPRIACFNGLTGYNAFLKYGEGSNEKAHLGLQPLTVGDTRLFVVPNPSPANAKYSIDDLAYWYQQLGDLRTKLRNDPV